MIDIGQRIKSRRKELGLSAENVAAQCGISAATMYRYEKNEIANMGTDKLQPIATALKTTPAYLMGWTDESEAQRKPNDDALLSPEALQLAQDFDRLSNDHKRLARGFMELLKTSG